MSELLSQYLFKLNYHQFHFQILIRNETSHTLFTKFDLIQLCELKKDGLVLRCPINICQLGHALTIFFVKNYRENQHKLTTSGPYKEAELEVLGKIIQIELDRTNPNDVYIDLHFSQYDVEKWNQLILKTEEGHKKIQEKILLQYQKKTGGTNGQF